MKPISESDAQLLRHFEGMYSGDKDGSGIECYSKKVVRTRSRHDCPGLSSGKLHAIPPGTRTVKEHALVDGKWRDCWTCESCVIAYALEYGDLRPQKCIDWKREDVLFEEHTKHVHQFLNDLWAFSIDPLHEGMAGLKVADVCSALLKAARDNRDSVYELEGLFRTACLWVWKGIDAPGQTLESTMEAIKQEYRAEQLKDKELGT